MGTHHFLMLQSSTATPAAAPLLLHSSAVKPPNTTNSNFTPPFPSYSAAAAAVAAIGAGGGPYWKDVGPTSNFRFDDDGADGLDEFGFGGAAKQRTWWFDDDDYDCDDGEDDEQEEEEESYFWVFKVIRAFGWMLPAVAISLVLGTGPNAFVMALAVPLGQTALSLVVDKVWATTSSTRPRPRTKSRKKPFARATSRTKASGRKEEPNKTGERRGSYQSWVAANDDLNKKGSKKAPKFGGWDELDGESRKVPRGTPSREANARPKQESRGKINRMGRVRDRPLLVRLLIAVFPFLGSWTRFLL